MFNKQKQSRHYEARKYKKQPKYYASKASKKHYETDYKPKNPSKGGYSFQDMHKEAKESLYSHKKKKATKEASPTFSHESDAFGAPDTPKSLALQKAKKSRQRLHLFYLVAFSMGLIGMLLSVVETITVSMILFGALIIISAIGFLSTNP